MEEYFDILDENGVLTGERRLRKEAHSLGLWHRVVQVYCFRKDPNGLSFLVHLRAKGKDSDPNTWDPKFGGHVQSGESIEETVVKELQEEAGLSVPFSDLIRGADRKADNGTDRELMTVYYHLFTGDLSDLRFNDGEVQAVKWMRTSDIMNDIAANPKNWSVSQKGLQKTIDDLLARV